MTPDRFIVNGLDLSAFVKDVTVTEPADSTIPGVRTISGTISGVWDEVGTLPCGNCGGRFRPDPEGIPTIRHRASGTTIPLCRDWAVAVLGSGLISE